MSAATKKVKVLICGPVLGRIQELITKLRSVNNNPKAGKFDMCLCVGDFFGKNEREDELCSIEGEETGFPIPVYITDLGAVPDSWKAKCKGEGEDAIVSVGRNLFHLRGGNGGADMVSLPDDSGLCIAFASTGCRVGSESTKLLEEKTKRSGFGGCDILLTSEWGQGMASSSVFSPADLSRMNRSEVGSYDVAQIAVLCKPRYHFAASSLGLDYMHFASMPFEPSMDGVCRYACRFIALSHVSSEHKFIHALGLQPLSSITPQHQPPLQALPNPYQSAFPPASHPPIFQEEQHQYRWNTYRPSSQSQQLQKTAPRDPNNKCLFLHGLNHDPSHKISGPVLLSTFTPHGATKVKLPPKADKSYAFVEFDTHEHALRCLESLHGQITVCGIPLTLKWSSAGTVLSSTEAPTHTNKKRRLTESQAADSDTLYVRLPHNRELPTEVISSCLSLLRTSAQNALQSAVNRDLPPEEHLTPEGEPAIRVSLRHPTPTDAFGFLNFASHAAAAMAITSLTDHTDGGYITDNALRSYKTPSEDTDENEYILASSVYWANSSSSTERTYPSDARTECWFCLSSPTCERHLIISIQEHCYVAMPKGALNPHHSLIVPHSHTSLGALSDPTYSEEIISIKNILRNHASQTLNKSLFVFERAFETKGKYHPHLQCIPVDPDAVEELQLALLARAAQCGFTLEETADEDKEVLKLLHKCSDYFYAEIPTEAGARKRFLYRGPARAPEETTVIVPLQFGREVLAGILGRPEAAQWKACVLDLEEETELADEFRKSFEGYAPVREGGGTVT